MKTDNCFTNEQSVFLDLDNDSEMIDLRERLSCARVDARERQASECITGKCRNKVNECQRDTEEKRKESYLK